MLELRFVRENLQLVQERTQQRGYDLDFSIFAEADARRRDLLARAEKLRHRRNEASSQLADKGLKPQQRQEMIEQMRHLSREIKSIEKELRAVQQEVDEFMLNIPNLPHDSVPAGSSDEDNVEVRRWGEPPEFDFDPRPHWEIGTALGVLDFERASKMSGSRFVVYKGLGARLERALINFMLELHINEHGYTEVLPPFLVSYQSCLGAGQIPKLEDDMFRCEGDGLFLVPTGEVPLVNLYRHETLAEEMLPIKLVAYTPCFRREAGTYGKDYKGLLRHHQFNKVELVKVTTPEQSWEELERLTSDAEEVLRRLGLSYRVVALCASELGFAAAKCYDLEVWLPYERRFREISSCSNCTDFQARRAEIRYRPASGGKSRLVHTLNGSGLAVGRTLAAILENYQQSDGTVKVPDALVPYMGGATLIG